MTDPIATVVADADVLAADLLLGGTAREAMDLVRSHSWLRLVASDVLLDDAERVIAELSETSIAADWRPMIDSLVQLVEHPEGDHPAIACALHGDARHVLSFDDTLQTAEAAAGIRARVETSVKSPDQFVRLFDPAAIYPEVVGGSYPGPDRDPRDSDRTGD